MNNTYQDGKTKAFGVKRASNGKNVTEVVSEAGKPPKPSTRFSHIDDTQEDTLAASSMPAISHNAAMNKTDMQGF